MDYSKIAHHIICTSYLCEFAYNACNQESIANKGEVAYI